MSRIAGDRMYLDGEGLLGPSPRYIVWFHGCSRNCPGCIAIDWNRKNFPAFELSVRTMVEIIQQSGNIEGITISGGEPFLQIDALYELVSELRKTELGIIIYSGYRLSELKEMSNEKVKKILSEIDVLIDGNYEEKLDDDLPYRGSSNQVIYQFTDRYRDFFKSKKKEDFFY
ncbi:4Fe-4S cluster-binding domain-containing protein [Ruminococcus sp. AF41-9]|nr:4Fe-4S cluster-binding domain-containing protein [Ruminococcus sp. AF41-9]